MCFNTFDYVLKKKNEREKNLVFLGAIDNIVGKAYVTI